MKHGPILAILVAAALPARTGEAHARPDPVEAWDRALIQGTWELVFAKDNGTVLKPDGNRITVTAGEWDAGGTKFQYRLRPRERPPQIDWEADGQLWKGIYRVTPQALHLCVSPPDRPRPDAFTTNPRDRRQFHIRKRVPSPKPAP
jgi:uncharacterized protein (TIGR03067 family)